MAKNNKQPTAVQVNNLLALFNQGEYPEALTSALSVVEQCPQHGFGWKVLGAIYQHHNQMELALQALKKAALFLPNDHEAQYNLGNCFYDQQQFDSAVICYEKAIQLNPSFAQAHYNLGNVFKKQTLLKLAEQCYKKALTLDADNIWIIDNLAHVLYEQGEFSEAEDRYRKALSIEPNFVSAQIGLAAVAKALGRMQEAEDGFNQAIKFGATFEAYSNLSDLLLADDRLVEAEACIQAGMLAHPQSVDAYVKMAVFLRTQGRIPASIPYFTQALAIDESRKDVHVDLGLAKAEQGFFAEAEACYRRAIELAPDYWVAYNNLGLVLHRVERYPESELAFNQAIELEPNGAILYSNLSLTLAALGRLKEAERTLKKAIKLSPEYVNAHINLCTNYIAQGRLDDAEFECFEALKYDPSSSKTRSNLLFAMNYSGHHSASYRLQQAVEFDHVVTGKVDQIFSAWHIKPKAKRLRIGLISGNLRQHPEAYFLENWVQNVDFSKFELVAYLTDTREDAFTGRLKPNFSYWKSLVGLTDQAAAGLIYDDAVDILLDLSGHTSGNRLPILAWKPAPIQVSWLGYFATTGMKAIDYFVADAIGVPLADQHHFVEKIKYLPDTRLCFTAPSVAIAVSDLPALSNEYITFASFQTLAKADGDVLELWAEVMHALPNARFRWQCRSFGDADVVAEVLAKFAKLGISEIRLILLSSVSREAYFASHHEVDVILDTFPYPGGTTTCEALWMGVPTLTLAGDSLIARQGASMLTAAGLAGWVAETKVEYISKALDYCSDLSKLSNLRAGLRAQVLASPLFDAKRFAKSMEIALLEMWHEHHIGNKETPLESNNSVQYQPLTKELYEQQLAHRLKFNMQIVSATRYSEQDFWQKSALGISLVRHLKQYPDMSVNVAFNNTLGLSEVFNLAIEHAGEGTILVFVHDDVWIDEPNFAYAVATGLEHFDVIGVAGNKRRLPNQPGWLFIDTALTWDDDEYLSGTVSHGPYAFGKDKFYGEAPAACELLDGIFIATKKSTMNVAQIRFDPQFDFHLYDIDFCRSARQAGLSLGTWPIKLTHQSKGAFGSPHWAQKCQQYFNKWESGTSQQLALQDAMHEVMQQAERHEKLGQYEQAAQLYQEVLSIQPEHAVANYKLGILEFNLNGVEAALPRFESAVQSKPDDEQYWVTYIDALMESADVATVLDALELGQKFGLTSEVAQTLAVDFLKAFNASPDIAQEMRSAALAALQVDLKPNNKQLHPQRYAKPVFYIWAPPYTEYSSGVKVMYLLCDCLNRLGYEAYVTKAVINKELIAPEVSLALIKQHKEESRLQIAIYPEVQTGNPLLVSNVVRYLLNKPNMFNQASWFGSFHRNELVLHYDDSFAIPWIESDLVHLQTVNRNLFKIDHTSKVARKGFLVYMHRVTPDLSVIPDWCNPYQIISMKDPKTPFELAELYKTSSGLIVFERTAAILEAILCGCSVIASSLYGFSESSLSDQVSEVSWDFDQVAFVKSQQAIGSYEQVYDVRSDAEMEVLKLETEKIIHHFKTNISDPVELTPAYSFEIANKYVQNLEINSAVLIYRQLILDYPANVEVYYRIGEILLKIGLDKQALDFLIRGETYMDALPNSTLLDSIRKMYYDKLANAIDIAEDADLSSLYVEKIKKYT